MAPRPSPARTEAGLPGPDEGKVVGGGGTEPHPCSQHAGLTQGGYVGHGPAQHAIANLCMDAPVHPHELARRTDEHLTGASGLEVEGHRWRLAPVRAIEVAELHQLMATEPGVAVGDHEVTLPGGDGETGYEATRIRPRCIDDHLGLERLHRTVHPSGGDSLDGASFAQHRPAGAGPVQERAGGGGRVEHPIMGNAKRARETGAKGGLEIPQIVGADHLRLHPPLSVGGGLLPHPLHLAFGGGHPQGAGSFVLAAGRQLGG